MRPLPTCVYKITTGLLCFGALLVLTGCSPVMPAGDKSGIPLSAGRKVSQAERAGDFATHQMAVLKEAPSVFSGTLGFSETEIADSEIGDALTIYLFDDNGQIVGNDAARYAFPVLYHDDIVGIIEVAYIPEFGYDGDYSLTFGKSFGDDLNSIKSVRMGDALAIGNLGNRLLFAINGEGIVVFRHSHGQELVLNELQTKNILESFRLYSENELN